MRFEREGVSLWYGAPDARAPGEAIGADTKVTVTVGVQPVDASNSVELLYRINQGPTKTVAANWIWNDTYGDKQYFRVSFPTSAFRPGDEVEYAPICRCAGRQVPSPEEAQQFPSSFRVVRAAEEGAVPTRDLPPEERSSPRPDTALSFPEENVALPAEVGSQSVASSPEALPVPTAEEAAPDDQDSPSLDGVSEVVGHEIGEEPIYEETGAPPAKAANRAGVPGASEVFKSSADAQVDTVELPLVPETSKYERILAKLTPFLEERQPQDLAEENVALLAKRSGIERAHLGLLVQSAKLAHETRLPAEVFYGLAREGLPLNLDNLLTREHDTLHAALESVTELEIVPAIVGENIEAIPRWFQRLREMRTPLEQLAP